jgi:hypothetical protein
MFSNGLWWAYNQFFPLNNHMNLVIYFCNVCKSEIQTHEQHNYSKLHEEIHFSIKYRILLQIVTSCNNYLDSASQNQLLQLKFDLIKLCNTISSIQYIYEIVENWSKGKVIWWIPFPLRL